MLVHSGCSRFGCSAGVGIHRYAQALFCHGRPDCPTAVLRQASSRSSQLQWWNELFKGTPAPPFTNMQGTVHEVCILRIIAIALHLNSIFFHPIVFSQITVPQTPHSVSIAFSKPVIAWDRICIRFCCTPVHSFCSQTFARTYFFAPLYIVKGWSVTALKAAITDAAEKDKAKLAREDIIKVAVRTAGKVSCTLFDVVEERSVVSNKQKMRGRCRSIRKYKEATGRAPEPHMIRTKIQKRTGKTLKYVKVYDDDDSSWAFSDESADEVAQVATTHSSEYSCGEGHTEMMFEQTLKGSLGVGAASDKKTVGLKAADFKGMVAAHQGVSTSSVSSVGVVGVANGAASVDASGVADGAASTAHQVAESAQERERRLLETVNPLELRLKGKAACLQEAEKSDKKHAAKRGVEEAAAQAQCKRPKKARKALSGAALARALEVADKAMAEAAGLRTRLNAAKALDALRPLDIDLKEIAKRLSGLDNVYFDGNREEDGNIATMQIYFLGAASSLIRCWKGWQHSFSDKTRLNFEDAWKAYRSVAMQQASKINDSLRMAAILDLTNAAAEVHLNKDDMPAAALVLSTAALGERFGASVYEAGHAQQSTPVGSHPRPLFVRCPVKSYSSFETFERVCFPLLSPLILHGARSIQTFRASRQAVAM